MFTNESMRQSHAEFYHPRLMAGGAEMATLAGENQEVFMAAIFILHACKAVV